MKSKFGYASISVVIISFVLPAFLVSAQAHGAPECFISRPQTCDSYDYIVESKNTQGQTCFTRYFNSGGTQSSEGLGCLGAVEEETQKQKEATSSVVSSPVTNLTNETPTSIVANPAVVVSPSIAGDSNNVSSVVNNINSTSNNFTNSVNNSITNITNSSVANSISEYRTISVSGGYLVIGENGFGKFFPTKNQSVPLSDEESDEIVYLEKSELPKSISRAVDRLPESIAAKKSFRLSALLRNAESITEDVCSVSNRKLEALSRGTCVLEIPVGEGIYEHEIKVKG
jgi:hypothetical protein